MYLVYYLYVTIFSSFFFPTYAGDDNDPKQELFDQFINAMVPLIIVSFFNMELDKINNKGLFKVKLFFDDIFLLLSLYILPSVIMIKNSNTPIWGMILYGVAAFIVVIDMASIRLISYEGKLM